MLILMTITTAFLILTKNVEALAFTMKTMKSSRISSRSGLVSLRNLSSLISSPRRCIIFNYSGRGRAVQNSSYMSYSNRQVGNSMFHPRSSMPQSQALYSSGSDSESDGSKQEGDSINLQQIHQNHESVHSSQAHSLELEISTIEDMEDVGAVLSVGAMGGDILTLDGDLGAGKTCFSRGFVRASTGVSDLRVTSPTYLLSNTYPVAGEDLIIHHMDLYRLSEGEDFGPLNLPFVFNNCISLIEWPSRLGGLMPSERLEINFQIDRVDADDDEAEEKTRYLTLTPHGDRWIRRIQQIQSDGYLDDMIVEYEDDDDE